MTRIPTSLKIDKLNRIIERSKIDKTCIIWPFVNIYRSILGKEVSVGCFTEIGGSEIGDYSRIGSGCFIPSGVSIGKNCFIGPKTCFTNDKYPSIEKIKCGKSELLSTNIGNDVIIGANCTILPGINIGGGAFIGAGSVVTKDIKKNRTVYGNPAKSKSNGLWRPWR